jgi:hypothetical protein
MFEVNPIWSISEILREKSAEDSADFSFNREVGVRVRLVLATMGNSERFIRRLLSVVFVGETNFEREPDFHSRAALTSPMISRASVLRGFKTGTGDFDV